MDAVKSAITNTYDKVTASKKVADLQRDIVDPTGSTSFQRTDYGQRIADGDNWLVTIGSISLPIDETSS
jgi:hypothetical protein